MSPLPMAAQMSSQLGGMALEGRWAHMQQALEQVTSLLGCSASTDGHRCSPPPGAAVGQREPCRGGLYAAASSDRASWQGGVGCRGGDWRCGQVSARGARQSRIGPQRQRRRGPASTEAASTSRIAEA